MNCEFITILLQSPLAGYALLIYFCRARTGVLRLIYLHNKNPQQRERASSIRMKFQLKFNKGERPFAALL
jgi:hypothetical protein